MKKILIFLLLFLLILPAVWSLCRPGFFPSDDGEWMVIRLSDFHRSFVSGQIPVRFAARLNHGYGYPVFNFLYPLSFYWGELHHLLGFSFVDSIKLVFIFSFFLSGLLMYFFGRELWGKWGGLVAAAFYVYAPYRFLDVYVRGSIGEAVSFIFVPLIFWSLLCLSKKISFGWLVMGSLGLGGLITSHNIMAMLFAPLILIYAGLLVWQKKEKGKLSVYYLSLFLLGLGLSCFFWLPALHDKQFTVLDQTPVAYFGEHFPSLKQLLIPSWGYGPSVSGSADQVSYQIGIIHLLAIIFSTFLLVKVWRKRKQTKLQLIFFLFIFITAFFLMLPLSTPVWKGLPFLWRTQFPWRFLAVSTFSSSVLAGSTIKLLKTKQKTLGFILVILLVILANLGYAKPEFFVQRPESFYTTNEATTTVKDEYMPVWVKEKPLKRATERVEVIAGEAQIQNLFFNSQKTSFTLRALKESELQFNTVYFPGWQLKINNQPFQIDYNNPQGVIRFKVPAGEHQVIIKFGETPLRKIANTISLLALVVAGGLVFKGRLLCLKKLSRFYL